MAWCGCCTGWWSVPRKEAGKQEVVAAESKAAGMVGAIIGVLNGGATGFKLNRTFLLVADLKLFGIFSRNTDNTFFFFLLPKILSSIVFALFLNSVLSDLPKIIDFRFELASLKQ